MNDESFRATRRGLVALVGGAMVAGCSALPDSVNPSPPRLDGVRLSEITSGEVPTVPRTVPVTVGDDHVQGHVDRTHDLLSRAPLPFDERELPNGAMREEMNAAAEEARSALERARNAASPLEAMSDLRDARGNGRTVATAWAYIDEGLRRPGLTDDADALAADVSAFEGRWSYVGDDPVRALLVHGTVESLVTTATNDAEGRPENPGVARRPENLVTVSEYAADLERGRAAIADAAYLFDRLRADATPRDLESAFEDATESLLDTVRTATDGFEDDAPVTAYVDADVEQSPAKYPLRYLHGDLSRDASGSPRRGREGVASALLSAHRGLTRLRAFENLRERVEGGERFALTTADDVASLREAAVTAIETAIRETNHPHLSRRVLHNMAGLVANVDGEIGPHDSGERVRVDRIRREVGEYIYAAEVARATPAASDAVATALTSRKQR